jgi:hypothetical protein
LSASERRYDDNAEKSEKMLLKGSVKMFEDPESKSSIEGAVTTNIVGVGDKSFTTQPLLGGSLAHDSIEEDEAAEDEGEEEGEDEYEEEYMGFESLDKQTEYIDSIERTMKLMASKIMYLEKVVEGNATAKP